MEGGGRENVAETERQHGQEQADHEGDNQSDAAEIRQIRGADHHGDKRECDDDATNPSARFPGEGQSPIGGRKQDAVARDLLQNTGPMRFEDELEKVVQRGRLPFLDQLAQHIGNFVRLDKLPQRVPLQLVDRQVAAIIERLDREPVSLGRPGGQARVEPETLCRKEEFIVDHNGNGIAQNGAREPRYFATQSSTAWINSCWPKGLGRNEIRLCSPQRSSAMR